MLIHRVSPEQAAASVAVDSQRFPRYAVTLLVIVYVLHNLDRQIINILAEPIKHDLNLQDWQIGLMSGLSFAVFYATIGIPIARIAEHGNRSRIVALCIITWSSFTLLCGLAQNFVQLILARFGVAIGESGCTPAAHSLISDIVPSEKRASALGIYSMGGPIGGLIGMAMGGLVVDAWGWRAGFIIAAIPGIIIGVIVALTLKEPRIAMRKLIAAAPPRQTFKEAMVELKGKPTFWFFAFGSAFQAVVAYGHSAFLASFFFRNHAAEIDRIAAGFGLQAAGFLGLSIGLISGTSGMLGAFLGGKLADHHVKGDRRRIATQVVLCNLAAVPIYIGAMLVDSVPLALAILILPSLLYGMTYGPLFTVLQSVVRPHTRATGTSIWLLLTNLIGLGLGPLLLGILSDYFSVGAGMGMAEGLRWAQIWSTFLGLFGAWLYWQSRKTIVRDWVG